MYIVFGYNSNQFTDILEWAYRVKMVTVWI